MRHTVDNGAEVYTTFADLFIMLFMLAMLMMGDGSNPASSISNQRKSNSNATNKYLTLYVGADGDLFVDSTHQTLLHDTKALSRLLEQENTTMALLHTPEKLSIRVFANIQLLLEESGATEVSYIVEGEENE